MDNKNYYSDVIMSTMASQITGISIVCSTVCSGADQRKHQSSASVVFVRGIHRWPVDSPHKGPVTRKMFPFDDVIMWIVMVTTSYGHDTITIVITLLLVITDVFIVIIILLFFLPLLLLLLLIIIIIIIINNNNNIIINIISIIILYLQRSCRWVLRRQWRLKLHI